ncbi:MAG: hypothetical protein ABW199_08415 [Caulobacterales bacterium]
MTAGALSIDGAVSGFLRHRFMRALAASMNVLVVFGLVSVIVYAVFSKDSDYAALGLAAPLLLPILIVFFVFPVVLGVAATSALSDGLHRRIAALIALPIAWAWVILAPFSIAGGLGEIFGFLPQDEGETPLPHWQAWALIAMVALSMLVALEAAIWSWWQLTTSKETFFAARGWRPPVWRLFSTYRRHLGLPAFIANFARGRISLTMFYFGVAILNTGIIAALFIPIFMFVDPNEDGEITGIIVSIVVLALLLVLNLIGAGHLLDRVADRRATKLYQGVREWDDRAPVIFLRAFDQDDAKLHALTRDAFVKFPAGVGHPRTLDEILLEEASPYGPVIAIGDPRDPTPPLGAARIFVANEGADWQSVVSQLVSACKAIVMCPTTSAGVKWELELLARSNATSKTIFLANPEIPVEETTPLFASLVAAGAFPVLKEGQTPIAAYVDPKHGWRFITAKQRSLQAYLIALNIALQNLFGLKGERLAKRKKA